MKVAILGAGAIGPASAALAASRSHDVALWSPSGQGTSGMTDHIETEGALTGRFPLRIAATLEAALEGAEVALLAVPAYAHAALLPRLAAAIPPGMPLLIAPAAALSPLAFEALRAALGPRAPVGGLATTPTTARRLAPGRVRIPAIRAAVDVAAIPAAAAPQIAACATALFGHASPVAPDVLHPALANANPIIHAVLALANVTRIERAETWPQYELMTEASGRLMEVLQAERDALADACGLQVMSLAESLHRASGVPRAPLHEMGLAIAASGRSVNGPAQMETRYVTEDVPFGLSFYLWLAARRGVAMPRTEAVVTVLETLWARDLRDNALLSALAGLDLTTALRDGVGR
ncbi:NAD/NADP-dependent octopine/nopaline dehydrogenase family protein [Falsiroseomonas sp.]|uniref:NAD/NADP-dependent octopine/nopaline dehydrogenase family protein n=1 Tax=Falsiroseomonas sp. TaxID=2870721 RepID=UPI0027252243|nr:NAD/NADP-dependent octopine/nopaline dehydrogenase family protein [Falsiroseomonas sp.]MDO9501616.1 NAD/NADP octopine/nopaline dehydrogenase family protein [Falsiroseomonas sp.]